MQLLRVLSTAVRYYYITGLVGAAAIIGWHSGLILVVGAPIALTYAAFWVYAKTMDWRDARKARR